MTSSEPSRGEEHELTNLPMVGMVVTISPSFNLYKIVVLPAASRPTENREAPRLRNKNKLNTLGHAFSYHQLLALAPKASENNIFAGIEWLKL